jgi:hypothetical protein
MIKTIALVSAPTVLYVLVSLIVQAMAQAAP